MNIVLRLVTEANPAMEEPVTQKPDRTDGEALLCRGSDLQRGLGQVLSLKEEN